MDSKENGTLPEGEAQGRGLWRAGPPAAAAAAPLTLPAPVALGVSPAIAPFVAPFDVLIVGPAAVDGLPSWWWRWRWRCSMAITVLESIVPSCTSNPVS